MTTRRINKWQTALAALIAERRKMPFTWGTNDCCIFAIDAVKAVTGVDPAPDLRGTYTNASGATQLLDKLGGVVGAATERLGQEIPPLMAQVGDIVLINLDGRDTLSVKAGSHLTAPGAQGLVNVPMNHALRAWRCVKD